MGQRWSRKYQNALKRKKQYVIYANASVMDILPFSILSWHETLSLCVVYYSNNISGEGRFNFDQGVEKRIRQPCSILAPITPRVCRHSHILILHFSRKTKGERGQFYAVFKFLRNLFCVWTQIDAMSSPSVHGEFGILTLENMEMSVAAAAEERKWIFRQRRALQTETGLNLFKSLTCFGDDQGVLLVTS